MNRSLLLAAAVLFPAACGGTTTIGEAGDSGTGGTSTGGSSGSTATGGTGASSVGGGTGAAETGNSGGTGSDSGGTGNTTGGTGGGDGAGDSARLPCELLEEAGHRCVAAHSTVRVLVPGYRGSLYQVQVSDGSTQDVGSVDGYADAAFHDRYCASRTCVVSVIYDQSGSGNHLTPAPPGGAKPTPGRPASIGDLPTTVNGHAAYGLRLEPGEGYRAACDECAYPTGPLQTAVDDEPQTIYMVTSQHDLVNGCCFDYGNAETSAINEGNGRAEALYVGQGVVWGTGVGEGPWVMADLENGLFAGWENGQDRNISTNTSLRHDFITAVLVGDTADKNDGQGRFALYGGDATRGLLTTMYDGIRPGKPGYVPMNKRGSVVLSVAGDNSDFDGGRFYEGVIAEGAASSVVVDALQAAIVAAGYAR